MSVYLNQGSVITKTGSVATAMACCCTQPLRVDSIVPNFGDLAGGTHVKIFGQGFDDPPNRIGIGNLCTNIVWISSTEIHCDTAAWVSGQPTVYSVIVINQDQTTATLPSAYTYGREIGSISPVTGPTVGGTPVTITGHFFYTGVTVKFGTALATSVVVHSATNITCVTPAHTSGAVSVSVIYPPDNNQGVLVNGFTYINSVGTISPNSGTTAGGTPVTITGNGWFGGTTSVQFGGVSATSVVVVSNSTITCHTPVHAQGAVDVTVNSNGLTGTFAGGFTYNQPLPANFVMTGPSAIRLGAANTYTLTSGTYTGLVTLQGSGFCSVYAGTNGLYCAGNVSVPPFQMQITNGTGHFTMTIFGCTQPNYDQGWFADGYVRMSASGATLNGQIYVQIQIT